MKPPKTIPELTEALGQIMADAMNGNVKETESRIALNAATRIIEAVQAETRVRALAFATKQLLPKALPLDRPMWPELLTPTIDTPERQALTQAA